MRTVNKVGGANGTIFTEFYGNTTDVKPTEDVPNGSAFYEVDNNMQEYRFDKENSIWQKISSVTSATTGGGTTATGDYLPLSGGTMQGAINMSGYQVENASELTLGETGYVGIIPHEITSEIDNGTTVELSNPKTKKDIKLRGIDTPTNDNDTVNKKYADNIKEYGIEHSPVLDSGQEEFVLGQNDLAYVFKNSMVMDSGDRFYFADPVSLTDGKLVPFITSAMTGEEYHLLVGTYPKGIQDGTLAPVQIDGIATPTGENMAVNKKYVDDKMGSMSGEYIPLSGTETGKPVTGDVRFLETYTQDTNSIDFQAVYGSSHMQVSCNVHDEMNPYQYAVGELSIEEDVPYLRMLHGDGKGNYTETYLRPTAVDSKFKGMFTIGGRGGGYAASSLTCYGSMGMVHEVDSQDYCYFTGSEWVYVSANGGTAVTLSQEGISLNNHKIMGLATPVANSDAVNKQYVDSITQNQVTIQKADNENMCINLTVDGDESSGVLDLTDKNGNPVIVRGVDTPVQDTDAVNKKYFETHLSSDFTPTKDLDMKQYKLINTSAVEIYGGINDSENNTYFIREVSQASINTDTKIPEYVKVITGVHTGDTNQDVILRGIRAGQQKNDAVNYNQFKTLADSFERCQHDVESLNAWKMTFDENAVENTVNSIIKYTDVAYELTIASGEEQWYSYDLAMQSGYTPISATLVIDDTNPFVGHCSLDITPDGTYNALIYLKSQGDDKTCNCKVRLVWIKNQ